jgi:hypothetical protein
MNRIVYVLGDHHMNPRNLKKRVRSVRPVLYQLEGRELLNGAVPHNMGKLPDAAYMLEVKHRAIVNAALELRDYGIRPTALVNAATVTPITRVGAGGYQFLNFDGPSAGTMAGLGTNMNGISNSGVAVGVSLENNGQFLNFTTSGNSRAAQTLNINGSTSAMAFGVNSTGIVVGTDGIGNAFFDKNGAVTTFIPPGGTSALAFGINDTGSIVGQYATAGGTTPGFIRVPTQTYVTINAPSGPDTVNAQSINNNGLVVGFYIGNDGNDHGFMLNASGLKSGTVTGVAIPDPVIPSVPGEPGATFVFSQVLAVNDHGIAVGYYGDSTLSQHGFIYNTNTRQYTFLDDPSERFDNGVEVTQITGINNAGEITGFDTDANGVAHGFVANPVTNSNVG